MTRAGGARGCDDYGKLTAHAKVYFEEKFDGAPGPLRGALTDLQLYCVSVCARIT